MVSQGSPGGQPGVTRGSARGHQGVSQGSDRSQLRVSQGSTRVHQGVSQGSPLTRGSAKGQPGSARGQPGVIGIFSYDHKLSTIVEFVKATFTGLAVGLVLNNTEVSILNSSSVF